MSKSTMVWATKYRLLSPKSIKDGTWREDGAKEELYSKLVPRAFVEDRNSHQNNELYVIDEEKTIELMEDRENSVKENAIKKQKENATTADLIDAIAGKLTKDDTKSTEPDESWTAKELKTYCKDNDISFRGNPSKKTLLELIYNEEE